MKIVEYAKAHPWTTGVVVIIGGIIFIMIVRGSGGSSESSGGSSGPSDAEIAANAQIAAAQIAANAQTSQAGAAVQAAQIGAGVQLNSDNKAAEVAMAQIAAQRDLGMQTITSQENAVTAQINATTAQQQSILSRLGSVKKKNRDDVLQALITGQQFHGDNSSPFWNNIGGALSGLGSAAQGIGSIFSDQRLKENITYKGEDAKGRGVYEFNYKGSKTRRLGFIAQDVARSSPDVVFRDPRSGFLKLAHM